MTIDFISSSMNKKLLFIVLGILALAGAIFFVLLSHQAETPQLTQVQPPAAAAPAVNLDELKTKAEAGDAAAQIQLGWAYEKGSGVKTDMKAAVKWFQQAADQHAPEALAALGELTQAGQGTKRDLTEAARLYRLAAEKGSVAGQYNLAYLYEQGSGVDRNEKEAAHWYQLAAEGGDPLAQFDIGQRCMLGVGIATNQVEALKWLTLAAAQGQADSARLQAELKSRLSSAEITEASRLAREFVVRAAPGAAK